MRKLKKKGENRHHGLRLAEIPAYSDLYDWEKYSNGINLETIKRLEKLGFHADILDYTRIAQLLITTDDGNYIKIASIHEFGVYLVEYSSLRLRGVYKRMVYPSDILRNKRPIGRLVNGKAYLYSFHGNMGFLYFGK